MKRELFQNISAIPYTSGESINREGFLSAVIGANVASGATVKVTVEHSDDGETFVPVTDELVFPDTKTKNGVLTFTAPTVTAETVDAAEGDTAVPAGGVVNIDVDLVGLMSFIRFTVEGASELAVVLGDSSIQPV